MTQHAARSRSSIPRRLRSLGAKGRSASRAVTSAAVRPTRDGGAQAHFTDLFVAEPELIRAYTEPGNPAMNASIRTILDAALQAADDNPDYADLQYFAARAALRLGDTGVAEALVARALALNPYYVEALILAAKVAQIVGDLDRAITCLNRALAAGADYPDVHLTLASLWQSCGDAALARQACTRSLELNPTLGAARETLGQLEAREACEGRA